MKKYLSFILLALASFAFIGCADVPAPYGIPEGPTSKVKVPPYSESFSSSLGKFQSVLQSGEGAWVSKSGYAMAKGYNGTETVEGCYYLVSPEIDLTNLTEAHVAYQYILAYNKAGDENQRVLIACDYDSKKKPAEATWVLLKSKHTSTTGAPSDWNAFNSADITIPQALMGKIVRIAFAYNCPASGGTTWEIKNFSIQSGKGTEDSEEDGTKPLEFKDFCNGDCETWVDDSLAFNWVTKSAARNCKTVKSADSHTGTYSLKVIGESVARRLGYAEMKMEAGTYIVSFYAKAATTDNAKIKPGYCKITNFKDAVSPIFANNTTVVSNESWTNITDTITLTQTSTVALVIQNAKQGAKSRDLLIDDYSITKVQ